MGGKNHQPCNRPGTAYLKFSTAMSRAASNAYRHLETANVNLEDLILAELDQQERSVDPIVQSLNTSVGAIEDLRSQICALRTEMRAHGYVNLPTFKTINLDRHGEYLADEGLINRDAWNEVTRLMKDATFYGVLDHYDAQAHNLASLTLTLAEKISALTNVAACGELHLVLEENRTGNFKVEFARLYTAWGRFNAKFLASSLLTTEMWYEFTRHGSLLDQTACAAVA